MRMAITGRDWRLFNDCRLCLVSSTCPERADRVIMSDLRTWHHSNRTIQSMALFERGGPRKAYIGCRGDGEACASPGTPLCASFCKMLRNFVAKGESPSRPLFACDCSWTSISSSSRLFFFFKDFLPPRPPALPTSVRENVIKLRNGSASQRRACLE